MITNAHAGPLAAVILGGFLSLNGSSAMAQGTPFDEADVFAELNDTDRDLGLHALIDGDEWKRLVIRAPDGSKLLDVSVEGRLRRQGLTELFFESAEPPFAELPPGRFFRRFPEGDYEIKGRTLDGERLLSVDEFTHLIPAPVGNVLVSGIGAATNCDADDLPSVSDPVIISWDPVTRSHPDLGRRDEPITIVRYEFVVEFEFEEDQEEKLLVFTLELPPDVTQAEVPPDFTALAFDEFTEFKFEILAVEESGNRTAVESCFEIE